MSLSGSEHSLIAGITYSAARALLVTDLDKVEAQLRIALFHSCGWITFDQARGIADFLCWALFNDESIEKWGLRLHAEIGKDGK